jgi:hypothetical protein
MIVKTTQLALRLAGACWNSWTSEFGPNFLGDTFFLKLQSFHRFLINTDRLRNLPASFPMSTEEGAVSLGVERPGREADHSPPTSAEVKNSWGYTSIPPLVFMAGRLVKHRDNLTFHQHNCLHIAGNFSSHHRCVQTGSGAHPTSYSMDTGVFFPGGKAAGA